MKDNAMKWPLLILCLAVWGAVYYVLFAEKTESVATPVVRTANITPIEMEKFDLSLDYDDPFLNRRVKKKRKATRSTYVRPAIVNPNVSKSIIDAKTTTEEKKKKPVIFPKIEYNGYVRQKTGGHSSAANVVVDGTSHNWDRGKKINGMVLREIHFDSIRITLNGEWKTINRK